MAKQLQILGLRGIRVSVQVIHTQDFLKAYQQLSLKMRGIVDRKIELLAINPAHPGLQAHRLKRANADDVWSCSISFSKRLIYQYRNSAIYLYDVGEHGIVDRVHLRNFKVC
jgi:mRNA interferase RelE/StbE